MNLFCMKFTALLAWTVSSDVLWACLIGFAVFNVLFGIFSLFFTSYTVFRRTMVRTKRNRWGRECSDPDPEQQAMFRDGMEWAEGHRDRIRELHTVHEGLNLYAEYCDFGYDRAVIIVPGRTEGLCYGYYFAAPYAQNGYNILTIDQRSHGMSDGTYNCIGFDEHRDLIHWAKILHEEYGVRAIMLHGICIGSACSLYALTSENAPDYFLGLVAEGMYPNFRESYKNHMIEYKKPTFIIPMVEMWMKHYTGYTMYPGPLNRIDTYKKPFLMLHGTADAYSLPERAEEIYEKAGTADGEKRIVWFEKGRHSRLRILDRERYDGAIESFLREVIEPKYQAHIGANEARTEV